MFLACLKHDIIVTVKGDNVQKWRKSWMSFEAKEGEQSEKIEKNLESLAMS